MENNMDTCFENSADLLEFFQEHIDDITKRVQQYFKLERPKSAIQQKSCAYFAVKDFIFENGLIATDCQINRIAEIAVCNLDVNDS